MILFPCLRFRLWRQKEKNNEHDHNCYRLDRYRNSVPLLLVRSLQGTNRGKTCTGNETTRLRVTGLYRCHNAATHTYVLELTMENDKKTNPNALEAMGLTFEEVQEADRKIVEKAKAGGRDRRICVCGHALSKHTTYSGILTCKPSALLCPCKKIRPVLQCDDTRVFLRKTEIGRAHV